MKALLNVGAGHPDSGAFLAEFFRSPEWRGIRLDIDPANRSDPHDAATIAADHRRADIAGATDVPAADA